MRTLLCAAMILTMATPALAAKPKAGSKAMNEATREAALGAYASGMVKTGIERGCISSPKKARLTTKVSEWISTETGHKQGFSATIKVKASSGHRFEVSLSGTTNNRGRFRVPKRLHHYQIRTLPRRR